MGQNGLQLKFWYAYETKDMLAQDEGGRGSFKNYVHKKKRVGTVFPYIRPVSYYF